MQILGWVQPYLTDQFIKLAFHPETFRTQPELIELERGRSLQNPPYMFRAFHLQVHTPGPLHHHMFTNPLLHPLQYMSDCLHA